MFALVALLALTGADAACNADIDCALLTDTGWRCGADGSQPPPPPTASNNCHLPGPGTAGNATCSCHTAECRASPRTPTNGSAAVQYLMIGDSISLGMQADLAAALAPRGWSLEHNPGNAASSNWGEHCLDGWVQDAARSWDVISFQARACCCEIQPAPPARVASPLPPASSSGCTTSASTPSASRSRSTRRCSAG